MSDDDFKENLISVLNAIYEEICKVNDRATGVDRKEQSKFHDELQQMLPKGCSIVGV